jgi:hypothetical protein
VVIWYIFPRFGIHYQQKSGNPGLMQFQKKNNFVRVIAIAEFFLIVVTVAEDSRTKLAFNGFHENVINSR